MVKAKTNAKTSTLNGKNPGGVSAVDTPSAGVTRRRRGKEEIKSDLLSSDPTRDYQATRFQYWGELSVQNLPQWRLWTGRMMLTSDPIVNFSLNIRNAALMAAEVTATAKHPLQQKWVQEQWDYLWNHHRPKLVSAKKYGFAPLQIEWKMKNGLLCVGGVKDFAPEDCRAIETTGSKLVGMRVKGNPVYNPQALWLKFGSEFGIPYGVGTLRRSYPSWYEKWMDHGAKRLLQLRMVKDAYIGDIFWYPPDMKVDIPDGSGGTTSMSYRDLVREIGENRLSGGMLAMPMKYDSNHNKLTDYTPPQNVGGITHIFDWVDGCDEGILRGADIPIEVVKAQDTGSGFSGRSVPFLVMLSTCTQELVEIVQAVNEQVIRQGAWLNWGGEPDYELEPKSLVESFSQDTSGSAMGGSAVGAGAGGSPPQQQQIPGQQPPQAIQQSEEDDEVQVHHKDIVTSKIGKATLQHRIDGPDLYLYSLRVPQKHRGQGHAERAMKAFTKTADKHGLPSKLIASPLDKRTNGNKLVNFYKKHGYQTTGHTTHAGFPEMVRPAKGSQHHEEHTDSFQKKDGTSSDDGEDGCVGSIQFIEYPLADRDKEGWYSHSDYEKHGIKMVHMHPKEYLKKVRPLDIDESSRDNINDLKKHIKSGKKLDPLSIYPHGKEDGRHRAHAAHELGIKKVPVLIHPEHYQHSEQQEVVQYEETEAIKRLREFIQRGMAAKTQLALKNIESLKKSTLDPQTLAGRIEIEILAIRPYLTSQLAVSGLSSYLKGVEEVVKSVPKLLVPTESPVEAPTVLPTADELQAGLGSQVELGPLTEALGRLKNSPVAVGSTYLETAAKVHAGSFAITGELTNKAVGDVKELLYETMREGKTKEELIDAVTTKLGSGVLSESHIETVLRTNQSAHLNDGKMAALNHPMVSDAFPYVAQHATQDARVRPEHMMVEHLGLDGTNIYNKDDPSWLAVRPPFSYNCRCSFSPVTVEQAARKGVKEAQSWLERAKQSAQVKGGGYNQYLGESKPSEPQFVSPMPFKVDPVFQRNEPT